MKRNLILLLLLNFCCLTSNQALAKIKNPCDDANILSLANRPSNADSACTVPFKKAIIEIGYQYSQLIGGGNQHQFPQANFRLGLPNNTEFSLFTSNYDIQSVFPKNGFESTTLGLKHIFWYDKKWLITAETIITLPSGNKYFGSNNFGGEINGIVNYNFTDSFSALFTLGVSSQTLPSYFGGSRYTYINPDFLLSYTWKNKISFYAEIYGQTKIAPNQGGGFNFDEGILFALTNNFEIDVEIGQRGSGQLGGFNYYAGTGFSWLF